MTKRVLIADDEPNIVVSLEFLMQQAGYAVRVAETGEAALREVAEWRPELVLLDVMLPGMDGYQVLQEIRAHPEWRQARVVMLTARGREVEVAKGMALGADLYLTKPFATRELVSRVRELLGDDDAAAPA